MAATWDNEPVSRLFRLLVVANVALLVAMSLHATDHIVRGTDQLTAEVFWGGVFLAVIAVGTLPLTLRHHPRAPLAAAVVGLYIVVGVSAAHLAPHWSAFSDPYPDLSLGFWSWAAMLTEVVAALVFGVLGLEGLRRQAAERRAGRAVLGAG
jgi:hypothetical protein